MSFLTAGKVLKDMPHPTPRYFSDPWQHLPKDGYTKMFENILLTDKNIDVRLNMDYFKYV